MVAYNSFRACKELHFRPCKQMPYITYFTAHTCSSYSDPPSNISTMCRILRSMEPCPIVSSVRTAAKDVFFPLMTTGPEYNVRLLLGHPVHRYYGWAADGFGACSTIWK